MATRMVAGRRVGPADGVLAKAPDRSAAVTGTAYGWSASGADELSRRHSSCLNFQPELSESLTALSRREGATLFMTLLAAFKALLYRYTGQRDIVIGTPVANRNREELEELIGFFVNTLALRTDFSGDPTFRELLERVREVSLGAYAHQDLPFELLVEELQPVRDLSRNPIFQIVFDLQNAPAAVTRAAGTHVTSTRVHGREARVLISNYTSRRRPKGLPALFVYSTNLFAESTVRQTGRAISDAS